MSPRRPHPRRPRKPSDVTRPAAEVASHRSAATLGDITTSETAMTQPQTPERMPIHAITVTVVDRAARRGRVGSSNSQLASANGNNLRVGAEYATPTTLPRNPFGHSLPAVAVPLQL